MSTVERHATCADDWGVYGDNLAEEAYHDGAQFRDARRLMLASWEGWTSGEPGIEDVAYEMLATLRAMIALAGVKGVAERAAFLARAVEDAA